MSSPCPVTRAAARGVGTVILHDALPHRLDFADEFLEGFGLGAFAVAVDGGFGGPGGGDAGLLGGAFADAVDVAIAGVHEDGRGSGADGGGLAWEQAEGDDAER